MSAMHNDIGPTLPSPALVWTVAKEIARRAEEAKRFAAHGPERDLPRALRQFEAIRALLGPEAESALGLERGEIHER